MELPREQTLLRLPAVPWTATIFASAIKEMAAESHGRRPQGTAPTAPRFQLFPAAGPAAGGDVEQDMVRWIQHQIPESEPSSYVLAFIYIRRVLGKQEREGRPFPAVDASSSVFYRLVVVTLMVANKYLTERVYTNAHYAAMAGLTTAAMNELERYLLSMLNYNLHVDKEDYDSCYAYLECTHRELVKKQEEEERRQRLRPRFAIMFRPPGF